MGVSESSPRCGEMKPTVVFCRVKVNIHPIIIWNLIEVFRDPKLLSRVRAELAAANVQGVTSNQDVEKLLSLPLLQSIYAELLRLRVEVHAGAYPWGGGAASSASVH